MPQSVCESGAPAGAWAIKFLRVVERCSFGIKKPGSNQIGHKTTSVWFSAVFEPVWLLTPMYHVS